ncbi:MAG TPA: TetR/AcrR family transcriptional regulator [Polyangiaceae bacterium]
MSQKGGYHHGDLRRALLDTVLAMVVERGDAGDVTLREVARRAGVSHNAPYRHFDGKETLLAAVATEGFAQLSCALRAARSGVDDAEERFVRTGVAYLRFALDHWGHVAVMHGPGITKSQTRELQQAANDTFQVLKELAEDAGVVEVADARRCGVVVWSFVHGLAVLTTHRQVPPSVGGSPESTAELGLRSLYRSFSAGTAKPAKRGRAPRA